jgi:hypothetical protein
METRTILVRVVALALMACGGTATISVDPDGGGGSSSGGSSGTSSGGTPCTTGVLPGDMACVPGIARAGQPIQIDVGSSDGCMGCFSSFEPCSVIVSGSDVRITMKEKTCKPAGDVACPAICAQIRSQCTIPALAEGRYTVRVDGDKPNTGMVPRTLVVSGSASDTSCKLLSNGQLPASLGGYGTACAVDEDCAVAALEEVCQPCKCPNAAIAKSEVPKYEADLRERSSQCPPTNGGIACAACQGRTAFCNKPTDGKGVCMLQPIR